MRAFRLSRIERLITLEQTFTHRPPQSEVNADRGIILARIKFSAKIIHRVRERQHYAFENEIVASAQGDVIATYRLNRLDELRPWLLSWGSAAEILEPAVLRTEIREELNRMLDMLT